MDRNSLKKQVSGIGKAKKTDPTTSHAPNTSIQPTIGTVLNRFKKKKLKTPKISISPNNAPNTPMITPPTFKYSGNI